MGRSNWFKASLGSRDAVSTETKMACACSSVLSTSRAHMPGSCTTCAPAPCAYLFCIVFLVWLDDPQVQKELSQHQQGIQDHQADDDHLLGKSKRMETRVGYSPTPCPLVTQSVSPVPALKANVTPKGKYISLSVAGVHIEQMLSKLSDIPQPKAPQFQKGSPNTKGCLSPGSGVAGGEAC